MYFHSYVHLKPSKMKNYWILNNFGIFENKMTQGGGDIYPDNICSWYICPGKKILFEIFYKLESGMQPILTKKGLCNIHPDNFCSENIYSVIKIVGQNFSWTNFSLERKVFEWTFFLIQILGRADIHSQIFCQHFWTHLFWTKIFLGEKYLS